MATNAPSWEDLVVGATGRTSRRQTVIDDALDYAKIAAGKLEIERAPCAARSLVEAALRATQAAATAKGVKICKEVDPLLPRALAERPRIVRVLAHLLMNAVEHTPASGVATLSAGLGRREHEGTLLFKVRDAGEGIPAQRLQAIFDLAESARGDAGKGRQSLGLAFSRAIIELHGGRIWAESWESCGATFCFTLPIASVDLVHPVMVYARPPQFHGLAAALARRLNAFLTLVV